MVEKLKERDIIIRELISAKKSESQTGHNSIAGLTTEGTGPPSSRQENPMKRSANNSNKRFLTAPEEPPQLESEEEEERGPRFFSRAEERLAKMRQQTSSQERP